MVQFLIVLNHFVDLLARGVRKPGDLAEARARTHPPESTAGFADESFLACNTHTFLVYCWPPATYARAEGSFFLCYIVSERKLPDFSFNPPRCLISAGFS